MYQLYQTDPSITNYGAVLQAYTLCKIIKSFTEQILVIISQ